jgi:hypothetical protein
VLLERPAAAPQGRQAVLVLLARGAEGSLKLAVLAPPVPGAEGSLKLAGAGRPGRLAVLAQGAEGSLKLARAGPLARPGEAPVNEQRVTRVSAEPPVRGRPVARAMPAQAVMLAA